MPLRSRPVGAGAPPLQAACLMVVNVVVNTLY